MAFFDAATSRNLTLAPVFTGIAEIWASLTTTPFERRGQAMADRVVYLRSLSDEELSARGLTRDEILKHVFTQKWR